MVRVMFGLSLSGWMLYSFGTLAVFLIGYEDETEIHFYLSMLVGFLLVLAWCSYFWWEDERWWRNYFAERDAERAAEEAAKLQENSNV